MIAPSHAAGLDLPAANHRAIRRPLRSRIRTVIVHAAGVHLPVTSSRHRASGGIGAGGSVGRRALPHHPLMMREGRCESVNGRRFGSGERRGVAALPPGARSASAGGFAEHGGVGTVPAGEVLPAPAVPGRGLRGTCARHTASIPLAAVPGESTRRVGQLPRERSLRTPTTCKPAPPAAPASSPAAVHLPVTSPRYHVSGAKGAAGSGSRAPFPTIRGGYGEVVAKS